MVQINIKKIENKLDQLLKLNKDRLTLEVKAKIIDKKIRDEFPKIKKALIKFSTQGKTKTEKKTNLKIATRIFKRTKISSNKRLQIIRQIKKQMRR